MRQNIDDYFNQIDILNRRFDHLLSLEQRLVTCIQEPCPICSYPSHSSFECPYAYHDPKFFQNHVNTTQLYAQTSYARYANTYNPGWWNHPNSSWQSQNYGITYNPYLRGYETDYETAFQTQSSRKKSLEEIFQAFMESRLKSLQRQEMSFKNWEIQ